MKAFIKLLIVIFSLGLFLTSCDPKKVESEYEVIDVIENITSNTNWGAGKVYVIKKNSFEVESELTIGAGTVIKFTSSAGKIKVRAKGKIIAQGSSGEPIVFTSIKDDDNGGDTNDDGGVTVPATGDWESIELDASSGSQFLYCHFLYGGKNESGIKQNAALNLAGGSSATIENCTFANNGGGPFNSYYYGALHAQNANSSTVIKNNLFHSNSLPITINSEINIDNSNSFEYNGKSNVYNGIFTSGSINNNTSWFEDEVPFVITTKLTNIKNGVSLTLGNNVVLKFESKVTMNLIGGENALKNHDGNNVWFTSIKDDELKGDTNGDGFLSTPQSADWVGIFIDPTNKSNEEGYATWDNIKYNDLSAIVK